jgi:hypothetical protein
MQFCEVIDYSYWLVTLLVHVGGGACWSPL